MAVKKQISPDVLIAIQKLQKEFKILKKKYKYSLTDEQMMLLYIDCQIDILRHDGFVDSIMAQLQMIDQQRKEIIQSQCN